MSAIKFGESLSKFMIPIALLEKFGSLTFITGIEINHMSRHSSKPNKLRYKPRKRLNGERRHPKMENLLYQNQSHRAYHKF